MPPTPTRSHGGGPRPSGRVEMQCCLSGRVAPARNRKSASMTLPAGSPPASRAPNTMRTYSDPRAVRRRSATVPSKRRADAASASCRCGRRGSRLPAQRMQSGFADRSPPSRPQQTVQRAGHSARWEEPHLRCCADPCNLVGRGQGLCRVAPWSVVATPPSMKAAASVRFYTKRGVDQPSAVLPTCHTPETMTHVHNCLYYATVGLITAAHYTRRTVASSVRLWRGVSGWCTFR